MKRFFSAYRLFQVRPRGLRKAVGGGHENHDLKVYEKKVWIESSALLLCSAFFGLFFSLFF